MSVHQFRPRYQRGWAQRLRLVKNRIPERIPVELTEEQWSLVRSAVTAHAAQLPADDTNSAAYRDMAVAHELISLQIAHFKRDGRGR